MIVEGILLKEEGIFTEEVLKSITIPIGKEVTLEFDGPIIGKIIEIKYIKGKGILVKVKIDDGKKANLETKITRGLADSGKIPKEQITWK